MSHRLSAEATPRRGADLDGHGFTPHTPAPAGLFAGRERELDLIFGHVRPAHRGSVAISGPVGSGKSSVLRMVADPEVGARYGLSDASHLVLYVDVQSISPFGRDAFWRRVARLLRRAAERPAAALARTEAERLTAALLSGSPLDLADVEEFLDALSDRDVALVLLLDEFEWALHATIPAEAEACRHFLAQMASLARRTPRTLSLVVATARPLPEALNEVESWRGSPFSTVFTSIVLKPLRPVEAEPLIARAVAAGRPPREGDRDLLWAVSDGQPAILQAACAALADARRHGLDDAAVRSAAQEAAARARAAILPETRPAPAGAAGSPPSSRPAAGLWIDEISGVVVVDGRREDTLTALEFSLLKLLYESPGRLCSKQEIIREVWGVEAADDIDDARVEKLISRLRRKIEASPGRPRYVRTVRGRGYRFVAD